MTAYDYDLLAHLPSDVQCIVRSSHSAKKDTSKRYLGGAVSEPENMIVTVEIMAKTDESADEVNEWFTTTLNGGTSPFTIFHKLFGKTEHYVFKIIDEIREDEPIGTLHKVKFMAEALGVSSPTYTPIEFTGQINSSGVAQVEITPIGLDRVYDLSSFSIDLDGINYPSTSAERIDDVLYVEIAGKITDYPTSLTLVNTTTQQGVTPFSIELENNSVQERILPLQTSSYPYVPTHGEDIRIFYDDGIAPTIYFEDVEDVTVLADGEEVAPVNFIYYADDNSIIIYLSPSRPIYKYEEVIVKFNTTDNIYLAPFDYIDVNNTSTVLSLEANSILDASVISGGTSIVASMSIPQDRTYDASKFALVLDGEIVSNSIVSVIQQGASLTVITDFIIREGISSVQLVHLEVEWGFADVVYNVANNSTISKITCVSSLCNQAGTHIIITLDEVATMTHEWDTEDTSLFTVSADGVDIEFDEILARVLIGSTELYFSMESARPIYDGETVLISYNETTNIEIESFSNQSVANQSIIVKPPYIVSGSISSDGLTITCTMSESLSETYTNEDFTISHGYLTLVPVLTEQSGTVLTIDLATPVRANVYVGIAHTNLTTAEIELTNNSTVNAPEFNSAVVVGTGAYLIVELDEDIKAHEWETSEFVVKVNGNTRNVIAQPNSVNDAFQIWIYTEGTIYKDEVVTVAFAGTDDPQVYPFTDTAVTNGSSIEEAIEPPPVYLMTEAVNTWGGFYWLVNSAEDATMYEGKLCNASGDTWTYEELSARYNQDGVIDLSDDYYIDTGWTPSPTREWTITAAYNVVMNETFDTYSMHYYYDGSNWVVDMWYGNQETELALLEQNTGLSYTIPSGTYKIVNNPTLP